MTNFYVNKIINLPKRSSKCIECGKENLKDDAVLATTGSSEKTADYVLSVLCLSCETLMVITPNPGKVVGIHHSAGNQVTMRNS